MKSTNLFLLVILFCASCATPTTSAPSPVPTSIETLTPVPTATQTLTPIPSPTVTPAPTQIGGASGRIIFSYRKDVFLENFPELKGETNLFIANVNGTNVSPITDGLEDYMYLQDVSPDGTKALVAGLSKQDEKKNLYLINLDALNSEPTKIASGLPHFAWWQLAAQWIDNSRMIYIGEGEMGPGIYTLNADGTNPINIYKNTSGLEQGNPAELLAVNDSYVYWGGDTRRKEGNTTWVSSYAWVSRLDGAETKTLEYNGDQIRYSNPSNPDLVFSPDLTRVAWIERATPQSGPPYHNYLHVASLSDMNHPYTLEVLTGSLNLSWFPDGSKLLVFDSGSTQRPIEEYTVYYEKHPDASLASSFKSLYGMYEVTISPNLPVKNYNLSSDMFLTSLPPNIPRPNSSMDLYDISPDARQILVSTYEKGENNDLREKFGILSLESYALTELKGFNLPFGGAHWIP